MLQVSAVDSDCGANAMVNYTLLDAPSKSNPFYVNSISGEICVAFDLDYETKNVYEFFVIATDRGEKYKLSPIIIGRYSTNFPSTGVIETKSSRIIPQYHRVVVIVCNVCTDASGRLP